MTLLLLVVAGTTIPAPQASGAVVTLLILVPHRLKPMVPTVSRVGPMEA